MLGNKKGQIAETMTWTVATIIIIVTLIVSIFLSSKIAEANDLIYSPKKILESDYKRTGDLVMEKSIFVYFLSEGENRNLVYDWLNDKSDEEDFFVDFEEKINELNLVIGE